MAAEITASGVSFLNRILDSGRSQAPPPGREDRPVTRAATAAAAAESAGAAPPPAIAEFPNLPAAVGTVKNRTDATFYIAIVTLAFVLIIFALLATLLSKLGGQAGKDIIAATQAILGPASPAGATPS